MSHNINTMRGPDIWVQLYTTALAVFMDRWVDNQGCAVRNVAEAAAQAADAGILVFRQRYEWQSGLGFARIAGTDPTPLPKEDENQTIVWPATRSAPDERALLLLLARRFRASWDFDTAFCEELDRLIAILEKPADARAVRFRE